MFSSFGQLRITSNGAATLSLRKLADELRAQNFKYWLQWGRNFIVAETYFVDKHLGVFALLQWGRNFIVAETKERIEAARKEVPASMGPQLYRCGNKGRKYKVRLLNMASMGPQLYRCGNIRTVRGSWTGTRCFNGAATLSLRKPTGNFLPSSGSTGFNGAATLSLRKHDAIQEALSYECGASMGPQLYRCGNWAQRP